MTTIKRLPIPRRAATVPKSKPPPPKPCSPAKGRLSAALGPPTIKDQIILVTAAPDGPKSRFDHHSPLPPAAAVKRMHRP